MQFAATIHEAAGRIDEASAVFRFKARQTTGEFDDLGAHWTDSRAVQFNQHFLQPQRDAIEEGERLCRRYSELAASAKANAQQAEDELSAFFAIAEEFESTSAQLTRTAEIARQLSKRVMVNADSLVGEFLAMGSALATVSQD